MDFNVVETTDKIIEYIKKYYQKSNAKGAVVGLSGGKDSAVVASLMVKALGSENVVGIWLPCYSKETDRLDAIEVANSLGIKLIEHDLTFVYDKVVSDVKGKFDLRDENLLKNSNINLKPRLRTNILYYYAAFFTELYNGLYLVCGTSNKSEIYVGYFTKGGDNVCDIAPIRELYVDEVIQVGDYLDIVPKRIIHKTPDDGLSGQTDEEKLGFSYSLVKKVCIEEESGIKDNTIADNIREEILSRHKSNAHKFYIPVFEGKK